MSEKSGILQFIITYKMGKEIITFGDAETVEQKLQDANINNILRNFLLVRKIINTLLVTWNKIKLNRSL